MAPATFAARYIRSYILAAVLATINATRLIFLTPREPSRDAPIALLVLDAGQRLALVFCAR